MLLQAALILVAYYMGKKNIGINELYALVSMFLEKDEEE